MTTDEEGCAGGALIMAIIMTIVVCVMWYQWPDPVKTMALEMTVSALREKVSKLEAELALRSTPEAGIIEKMKQAQIDHDTEVQKLNALVAQANAKEVREPLRALQADIDQKNEQIKAIQTDVYELKRQISSIRLSSGTHCNCGMKK